MPARPILHVLSAAPSRRRRFTGRVRAFGYLVLLAALFPPSVGSVGPSRQLVSTPGAARWLDESSFTASSLETGRIGFLTAWGGDEFGYSYLYRLSDQPASLVVDPESGGLTLSSSLPVGTYDFHVTVSNRGESSKLSMFSARLTIRPGVEQNRSADQILHKTYRVDESARFGAPHGRDFTDVLMAVNRAIADDQLREGDGNLRATILFRRGQLYQYANNRWPWGVQYLRVAADPDVDASKPRPRLQGIGVTRWNSLQGAIIRFGRSWGHYYGPATEANLEEPKRYAFRIQTALLGQSTIRLIDPADAAKLKLGRYHMVASYDQQLGGFPPNSRYFDYVKVLNVKGPVVILDRGLHHLHREDSLESSSPNSVGRARIIALDRGDAGGLVPDDIRLPIRSSWNGLEFVANPHPAEEQGDVVEAEGALDIDIDDCVMPHLVPSNARTVVFSNSQTASMEGDKQVGLFLADHSVFTAGITEGTSVDLFFLRNSRMTTGSMMPAQFRAERSILDATGENRLLVPLYIRGPWATRSIEILASTITRRDRSMIAIGAGQPPPMVALGLAATWDGHRLRIPVTSSAIQSWLGTVFEGAPVFQGADFRSYGVVRKVTGSSKGDALQVDIEWLTGPAPTSGMLRLAYINTLTIDADSKLEGQVYLGDTGAVRQSVPANVSPDATRSFPPVGQALR